MKAIKALVIIFLWVMWVIVIQRTCELAGHGEDVVMGSIGGVSFALAYAPLARAIWDYERVDE